MCAIHFLKRTKNGVILYCRCSDTYQVLFKNINYNLTQTELDSFVHYVTTVDEFYWEDEYKNSVYNKRIPIPSIQANLIILLDRSCDWIIFFSYGISSVFKTRHGSMMFWKFSINSYKFCSGNVNIRFFTYW